MKSPAWSGGFTRNVPIDTMPLGIVRLSPKQVTVTGEMGTIAERSVRGDPGRDGRRRDLRASSSRRHAYRSPSADLRARAGTDAGLAARVAHITGSIPAWRGITVIAPRGITARGHSRFRHAAAAGDSPRVVADVVLGIETSCDETSAAVLVNGELASLVILSQDIHKIFGGVRTRAGEPGTSHHAAAVVDRALGGGRPPGVGDRRGRRDCRTRTGWRAARRRRLRQNVRVCRQPGAHRRGTTWKATCSRPPSKTGTSPRHSWRCWYPAVIRCCSTFPAWGRYRLLGETRDDAAARHSTRSRSLLGVSRDRSAVWPRVERSSRRCR